SMTELIRQVYYYPSLLLYSCHLLRGLASPRTLRWLVHSSPCQRRRGPSSSAPGGMSRALVGTVLSPRHSGGPRSMPMPHDSLPVATAGQALWLVSLPRWPVQPVPWSSNSRHIPGGRPRNSG